MTRLTVSQLRLYNDLKEGPVIANKWTKTELDELVKLDYAETEDGKKYKKLEFVPPIVKIIETVKPKTTNKIISTVQILPNKFFN